MPASLWAPTFATSFATASLGGVARPAISLRTPGFARCTTWIPDGATLALRVGASAPPGKEKEETTARVRLLRDRMAPVVLATSKFPSSKSEWSEMRVVVPSTSGNGMLATLEFAAVTGPDGSRVHFAEPRLTVPATPRVPPPPPVRGVVIVVASGVSTKSLAAYGGPLALPTLDALAGESVVFSAHRGSSAHASGNLASAITGALPRSHGVTDGDARLPEGVPTLAEIVRRAGIATGFFSAHPGTSAPFGFARGWDQSASYAPTESASAKRPFEDAAKFVDAHKDGRFLVVVHARAGHPPWDLTAEELRSIGPPGYTGPVDPRSAGELLARPARSTARLSDADRTRAMALHTRALLDQDAEFGTLLAAIKAAKRDVDTEIIFTGDVAMDESSPSPYAEGDVTDEAVLGLPLVVRRPAVPPARVATPTNPTDVAASVLGAFGLALPRDFVGVTFEDARADGSAHEGRVLVAESEGRFSLRRGSLVLLGSGDRDFRLCDLTLEPACVTDVRATYPLAHESMRSAAFDGLGTPEGRHAREPAPIDVATASSLRAWGR
ncbi:MAG: sulfatase-like hydrolase/transferase [Polyangiaceae bacterium]